MLYAARRVTLTDRRLAGLLRTSELCADNARLGAGLGRKGGFRVRLTTLVPIFRTTDGREETCNLAAQHASLLNLPTSVRTRPSAPDAPHLQAPCEHLQVSFSMLPHQAYLLSGRDSGRRGGGRKVCRDTQNRTPNPTQGGRASAGQEERGHHPHPIDPSLPNRLETWCLSQRCTLEAEGHPPEKLQPRGDRLVGPWLNCPPAIREKGAALTGAACAPDSSFLQSASGNVSHSGGSVVARRCGRRRAALGLRGT